MIRNTPAPKRTSQERAAAIDERQARREGQPAPDLDRIDQIKERRAIAGTIAASLAIGVLLVGYAGSRIRGLPAQNAGMQTEHFAQAPQAITPTADTLVAPFSVVAKAVKEHKFVSGSTKIELIPQTEAASLSGTGIVDPNQAAHIIAGVDASGSAIADISQDISAQDPHPHAGDPVILLAKDVHQ
jgi:hypothetical protein